MMYVYSGKCRIGRCGQKTNLKDDGGNTLYVGDIVISYHKNNDEYIECFCGLTVVVSDEFETYDVNGTSEHRLINTEPTHFIMGLKTAYPSEKCWGIQRVKRYIDVVDGECWRDYGFNYNSEVEKGGVE